VFDALTASGNDCAHLRVLAGQRELHPQTRGTTWLIVLAQVALGPIFVGLEGAAILWGQFALNTVKFHVVKK
jgi:hypothetical protein